MTVRDLGEVTVGAAIPCGVELSGALDAVASMSTAMFSAQLAGYTKLSIPAPSFSISAQLAVSAEAFASAMVELNALPEGPALAAALTGAVAAQLAAQAAIKAVAPDIALKIDSALAATAGLNAAVSAGISGPNVDLPTVTLKIAELEGIVEGIEAAASVGADLVGAFATGGIRLLSFDGAASDFGAEIGAAVSAIGIPRFQTVVLVATSEAAWGGLSATLAVG